MRGLMLTAPAGVGQVLLTLARALTQLPVRVGFLLFSVFLRL